MAKDINLTSKKWNDIVFEDRPKDYGAYEIRLSSSRRHIIAFVCIIVLMVFVAMLPKLIETVQNLRPAPDNISETTVLSDITPLEEILEDVVEQVEAVELPPLKETIAFTAPEIVDDSEINPDEQLKTQEELQTSKADISLFDVEGDETGGGVDLAELVEQQKIAAVVEEPILDIVQQKAAFQGGLEAMYAYLQDNVSKNYSQNLVDSGIQGNVTVKFAVMGDGSIAKVSAVSSPDERLSEIAVRVIKAMPKWIPAQNNGKVVASYFYLPVTFKAN